ncbi:MAG: peptidase [Verrucomicrobia bacterium]|nr:peptidase [Verrucomicrobiota bacterium]
MTLRNPGIAACAGPRPAHGFGMKSILLRSLAVLGLAVSAPVVFAGSSDVPPALLARATVSKEAATKTALAQKPGAKIDSVELEEEGGNLVWSFDLSTAKSTDVTEVQVDANSGKVVSVKTESAATEAAEAKAEKAEKK